MGVIEMIWLIGVLLSGTGLDAEPGVVRVRRAVVESRKKMRFMPLSYCGLRGRGGVDRQTTV